MERIKVGERNINNIRYADDTVLITDSEGKWQRLVDVLRPTDTYSHFNQGPYTYTNVTSLLVSCRMMCKVWSLKSSANETDKEVTFVYVYGPWLKRL